MTASILKQLTALPEGLLDVAVQDLHTLIPQPTLFHLPGKRPEALFVSVLLHGNESTGFLAMQQLLRKYQGQTLPRALSVFFGNVQAARQQVRRLDGQPDWNRVWPGTPLPESEETQLMAAIVAAMRERPLFASIDVHNNTGLNPHYACVNRLDNAFLQLGALFGRLLVHFSHPKGTQTAAFAALCPAVTLECGRPGQQHGVEHAFEYLDSCLHLAEIPEQRVARHDIDLYHTVAQVTVADDASFGFENPDADLCLDSELERMNFTDIPAGTVFGQVNRGGKLPVVARNDDGNDVTAQYFAVQSGQLLLSRGTMPSMLTRNERVIRQDCLCYLMERVVPA